MSQSKEELRKKHLSELQNLSIDNRKIINKQLQKRLFNHQKWHKAQVLGVTISMPHEWETWPIIEQAWAEKKIVVVPKCHPHDKSMTFHQIETKEDLAIQYFNLLEPIESQTKRYDKNQIDLLLVPGLVFDRSNYRIGHGGGYYDRFLADFNADSLSLAWLNQVVDQITIESFDEPVSGVIIADPDLPSEI